MSVGRTLTLTAVALGAGSLLAFGQATDAPQVLAAAREALGGEKNLIAVKTFVATGRTRQLCGNNLVPIEFEINCELPDRFVRKDEIPAQDTDVTVSGFTGDTLIQFPPPGPGRAGLCVWTNRRAAARRRRVWRRRVRASAHVRSGTARYRLQLFVNAQNLTNERNFVGYSGTMTSPFFGKPTAVSGMRKIDVGISLNF